MSNPKLSEGSYRPVLKLVILLPLQIPPKGLAIKLNGKLSGQIVISFPALISFNKTDILSEQPSIEYSKI